MPNKYSYESNLLADSIINELKPDGITFYKKSRLEELFDSLERDFEKRFPEEYFSDAILLLKELGYKILITGKDFEEYEQALKII